MIADALLIFIILFLLIYCMEDSFFALFVLFIVSVIETYIIAGTVTTSSEVAYPFLFSILVLYSLGSLIQWVLNKRKENKL